MYQENKDKDKDISQALRYLVSFLNTAIISSKILLHLLHTY